MTGADLLSKRRLAVLSEGFSATAEAVRQLRTALFLRPHDESLRSLLLTPASHGVEAAVLAANLAVSLAQTGRPVVLVDADLREPALHSLLAAPNDAGLTSALAEKGGAPLPVRDTGVASLRLLTAGPPVAQAGALLDAAKLARVLEELLDGDGVLVAVTSPAHLYADAAILAPHFGGVVLVVVPGVSQQAHIKQARQALAQAGAAMVGVAIVER